MKIELIKPEMIHESGWTNDVFGNGNVTKLRKTKPSETQIMSGTNIKGILYIGEKMLYYINMFDDLMKMCHFV